MRHLSYVLFSVLAVSAVTDARAAAVVTCTQPGYSQTVTNGICHGATGNTLAYEGLTGLTLQNGSLSIFGRAEIYTLPDQTAGTFPISASASWDDTFYLPASPAGDILNISVVGGGLGHAASIQIAHIDYTTPDFCDAHYFGNPVCTATETIDAASVDAVHLTGNDSVSIANPCTGNCGFSVNADLYESVTINRFLSDGVTPDPFTSLTAAPEPGAMGLAACGLLLGAVLVRRASGSTLLATARR